MTGNLSRQQRERVARDVGRIRENDIKLPRHCTCPISGEETGATGKTEVDSVADCSPHRALGDIDANSARRRKLGKEREQEAARTGAEIEYLAGRASIGLPSQHGLDHRLRLGPRVESVGRQTELQPPELASFEDAA